MENEKGSRSYPKGFRVSHRRVQSRWLHAKVCNFNQGNANEISGTDNINGVEIVDGAYFIDFLAAFPSRVPIPLAFIFWFRQKGKRIDKMALWLVVWK